jgi:uncharacterized protein YbgA (DUF1722 family)/uncharacterized protein YbbK (DUF523 family)
MPQKIKLGISACLLGDKVRYDGGHKLDHYLAETVGMFVDWVPVCPEVEAGLGIPREAMRLVGDPDDPRLVTRQTGIDHTDRMKKWAQGRIGKLSQEGLSGFIFKSRSPSSGMERVKVYSLEGQPGPVGSGIFARAFMDAFPLVPAEDDGRLRDPGLRENFIERVFLFHSWQELTRQRATVRALVDFHSDQKYLIMAHSPDHLRRLGRLTAGTKGRKPSEIYDDYLPLLMEGLKLKATVKKNVNVLQHMLGYFKKQLTEDEKREMLEIIDEYHRGIVPLIVPVTLMRHYVRKYDEPYLGRQSYLNPHPAELMLRNHV